MRTMLFVLTMALGLAITGLALAGPALAAPYCDRYEKGYQDGFCANDEAKYCPRIRAPSCPQSNAAAEDREAGYLRGWQDGADLAKRKRRSSRRNEPPPDRWEDNLQCQPVCTYDIRDGKETQSCQMQCS